MFVIDSGLVQVWVDKLYSGGRLEEALDQYKRSKEFGVDRAEMHIRNVHVLHTLLSFGFADNCVNVPG